MDMHIFKYVYMCSSCTVRHDYTCVTTTGTISCCRTVGLFPQWLFLESMERCVGFKYILCEILYSCLCILDNHISILDNFLTFDHFLFWKEITIIYYKGTKSDPRF